MKLLSIILLTTLFSFAQAQEASPVNSLVRVNMDQSGSLFLPTLGKTKPSTRRGLGAVLKGNKVLTAAKFVADASYLELEHPVSGRKIPAKVDAVDYEANLALLSPLEPMFEDRVPLEIDPSASLGDKVKAWQVESNGTPFEIDGTIVRAKVGPTFLADHFFLQYEVAGVMQFRGGSVTVPVVKDNKLVGLLVSYNSKEQISEAISGPVISHFLKDIAQGEYQGFPQFGVSVSLTLDDQFRKYLKLPVNGGGVYVSSVSEGHSADVSGIKKGDVILSISGNPIDARGYYNDNRFGKLSYRNLVRSQPFVGDEIETRILRDGKEENY